MGRRPRLTSEQRSTAIGMLHGGISLKLLPNILVLQLAPYRELKDFLWNLTGSGPSKVRGNKKTSAADDRYVTRIVVTSRRNRLMSAPKLTEQFHATSGIHVSTQTICNRLQKRDLRFTANHARARLNWLTAHHWKIMNEWNSVIHQKSWFCIRFSDRRVYVWCANGELFDSH